MIRSWRTELLGALTRREGRQPVFSLFSVPSAKQEAPPQMLCTGNLILYSQASRTVRNKCLLLKQLTVCNVQWSRDDQDGNHQHLKLQTQRILDPDPDQLPQGFRLSPLVHAEVVCGSEKWVCKAAVCWSVNISKSLHTSKSQNLYLQQRAQNHSILKLVWRFV